jgi:hypothetical protein
MMHAGGETRMCPLSNGEVRESSPAPRRSGGSEARSLAPDVGNLFLELMRKPSE